MFWNYYSEIHHDLFLEKYRIYTGFLKIISASTWSPEQQEKYDLKTKYIQMKQEIILIAPKNIVETIAKIEPLNFKKGNEDKFELYLYLLMLMRKDLKLSRKIDNEYLKKLI
ncbi:hypothetical protein DWW42_09865 [Limosilactobacillus fermentum]|nr:hypothetical protein DWW42_09865 [Limosilactobacillus fermentum]